MFKKTTRTQIQDLSPVELSADELALVAGGLAITQLACDDGHHKPPTKTYQNTNVVTGRGSWDTVKDEDPALSLAFA